MPRRSTIALLAGAACVALAALVWALTFHTHPGLAADSAALRGFGRLQGTPVSHVADLVAALCNPLPYVLFAGAVAVWALRTRGPRGLLATGAILIASNVASQLLKPALAAPRLVEGSHVAAASWPSGHSTAAMALVLCAVIAAPPASRRLVAAAGGLFAVAVAYSVVLLGWHFPSDAFGGFALAGAATSVTLAALWWAETRWPAGYGRRVAGRALRRTAAAPRVLPATAAALVVLAAGVVLTAAWLPGPREQAAFVAGAAGIAVLALLLAAACSRALGATERS